MAMTREDLEIYLDMLWKKRVEYYASPETLRELDRMAVKALSLFHNGVQNEV
jgi:hypothetical protein